MTRDLLEARIWAITGRALTAAQVDALVCAAEAYAVVIREEKHIERERPALRHEHSTDLYPAIAALAEAMLGVPQVPARRGYARQDPERRAA